MNPANASSSTGRIVRTGCVTRPLENRCSASAIVSMRSSIDSTAFTSSSVSRRKVTGMSVRLRESCWCEW